MALATPRYSGIPSPTVQSSRCFRCRVDESPGMRRFFLQSTGHGAIDEPGQIFKSLFFIIKNKLARIMH